MRTFKSPKVMKKIRSQRGMASKIAKACGINRAAVYQWERVPVERVAVVAKIMKMKRAEIRPDIFGE